MDLPEEDDDEEDEYYVDEIREEEEEEEDPRHGDLYSKAMRMNNWLTDGTRDSVGSVCSPNLILMLKAGSKYKN